MSNFMNKQERIFQLTNSWSNEGRWKNVKRPYTAEQVLKLAGSVKIDHTGTFGCGTFMEFAS
jgi:isocitrate lyase